MSDTVPVDIWLRGQDFATTRSIGGVTRDAAVWTDQDVRLVLEGMLREMHRLKHPGDESRPVNLRGLSWIVNPYDEGGVVIAIEITMELTKVRAAGETITPRIIAEAGEQGDDLARRMVMETAHWLAIGIVSLAHTIDPDAVVLGGAMTFGGQESPLGRDFLQRIRDEVRPRLLEPLRDKLAIAFATLGGDAGYIGAAGLARLEQRRQPSTGANHAS